MPRFTTGLSPSGFRALAKEIRKYKNGLQEKCEEFAYRLAEEGVAIAQLKISDKDAIYTGELLASMNLEQGDIIYNGASFSIYTDCPWAKFVEFGTGVVGEDSPHPDTSIANWKYDVNGHGNAGWHYFCNGKWHWTKGMPSRPFMYETAQYLRDIDVISHIAKEVFGSD